MNRDGQGKAREVEVTFLPGAMCNRVDGPSAACRVTSSQSAEYARGYRSDYHLLFEWPSGISWLNIVAGFGIKCLDHIIGCSCGIGIHAFL